MVLKDDVKRENPEGTAWVDFVTLIVQSYFDTLLSYVLSVTLEWSSCFKSYGPKDTR